MTDEVPMPLAVTFVPNLLSVQCAVPVINAGEYVRFYIPQPKNTVAAVGTGGGGYVGGL